MDEQKGENERAVYKSTLEEIVEKILQRLSKDNPQNTVIPKSGKSIGVLTFKKNLESKTKKIYSISMVIDQKDADYIYDEDGDMIAVIDREKGKIRKDSDIELNEQELKKNINSPESKEEQVEVNILDNHSKLDNLTKMKIHPDSSVATIDLSKTMYNGRRLKDVLMIDSKLKNRLPDGVDEKNLDYLTVVDSAELTAKDGKPRKSAVIPVVMDDKNNPQNMVELDSTILKPMDNISNLDKVEADKDSEILGDGKIKKGATTTTNTRTISTFEIIGAGNDIAQSDDLLTLDIRHNPKTIDESTSQRNDANNIEIYLGRLPSNASENSQKYRKDQNDNDNKFYQLVKLEAVNEVRAIDEIKMQDLVRNYYGVKDEDENIKGVTSGEGMEVPERDANALNRQMNEELAASKNVLKDIKAEEEINGAVAIQVNERQYYMPIAENIVRYFDEYTKDEICDRLIAEKQRNPNVTDDELQKNVENQLAREKVPGVNPRKMGY